MGSAAGQPNYGIFEVIKGRYEGAQQKKNVTVDLKNQTNQTKIKMYLSIIQILNE